MTHVIFAIPGDINLPTGGYAYDRRVLALLPECGVAPHISSCRDRFPRRRPATSTARRTRSLRRLREACC